MTLVQILCTSDSSLKGEDGHCGGVQGCQKVQGLCLVSPGALSALFSFTTRARAYILPSFCPTPAGSSSLKSYVEVYGVCHVDEPLSFASAVLGPFHISRSSNGFI